MSEHSARHLREEAFNEIEPRTVFRREHAGEAALRLGGDPGGCGVKQPLFERQQRRVLLRTNEPRDKFDPPREVSPNLVARSPGAFSNPLPERSQMFKGVLELSGRHAGQVAIEGEVRPAPNRAGAAVARSCRSAHFQIANARKPPVPTPL